jgi:caffeoyl-CoA O-methyltransferase
MDQDRRSAISAAALLALAGSLAPAAANARATEEPPRAASPDEQRVLDVLSDIYRNHRYLSVPEADGRLLRILVESIAAEQVVEVGTSTGYSGLWILLGLMRTGGHLTTYELDRSRHEIARNAFQRAGFARQVTARLGDAHVEVTKVRQSADLVFLDADKAGYLDYLEKLLPRLRAGGLVVAHNMASPPPDPAYLRAITTDTALETVFLSMDAAGIGVTLKKR